MPDDRGYNRNWPQIDEAGTTSSYPSTKNPIIILIIMDLEPNKSRRLVNEVITLKIISLRW